MERNTSFLKTAEALKPDLHTRTVFAPAPQTPMTQGDQAVLDFSEHLVGFVTLSFETIGSHPDAPAYLKLKFAETLEELSENAQDYNGWLSCSWIQEEYVHVDLVPTRVVLPRRYAFRYL